MGSDLLVRVGQATCTLRASVDASGPSRLLSKLAYLTLCRSIQLLGAGPHITFALTAILWAWLASCWAGVCHHALHPDQLSSAEEESV